ncbi:DUF192 domain-containing protein [Halosegnis marinus]|uniref:DUF192 domain-containing protein n=1 Tax=Halosegnis marinus TaxID=3034023 RepID=A0ABD5ZNP0_9EURY|nr:DUF192 domain-containing protein [Halosegnis sp. DT85]
MDRRYALPVAAGVVALLLAGLATGAFAPLLSTDGYQPATATATGTDATATTSDYAHTTVTVYDAGTNETLGSVRAAVAETWRQKYTGLSRTESLPEDAGMLFPYDSEGSHTYVMRGMDFGIDIVYVAANGTITRIHHAEEPPEGANGESYEYPGTGQYVLEVNYDWTTRHNVSVGDRVDVGDW